MKTLATILGVLVVASANSAIIVANSCNYLDVTNAIAQTTFGDTIILPAGNGSWYGTVNISGITLAGQGTNNTVISDNTPLQGSPFNSAGLPIIAATITNAAMTRITGITFQAGATNNRTGYSGNYGAEITIGGQCPRWQIDNCAFIVLSGKNIRVTDDSFGCVSHCYFNTQSTISLEEFGTGFGDSAWAAPTTYGSTNAVYFESNLSHDNFNFGWVDISDGGRMVYRFNRAEGTYVNTHGPETTQRNRSSRWIEVYGNVFTNPVTANFSGVATAVDVRGGGALVCSNVVFGYNQMCSINYYRGDDINPGYVPWFGATGINAWDNNGSLLFTGVATTSGTTLTVTTFGGITVNSLVGLTVYNPSTGCCGLVTTNTDTFAQFSTSRTALYQLKFGAGDSYRIRKVYPAVDMPGMGQSDLLVGASPTPIYLNFQTNIICNWNNFLIRQGNTNSSTGLPTYFGSSSNCGSSYPDIVKDRNYTNGPLVGYIPLPYPYPGLLTNNPITPPPIVSGIPIQFVGPMGCIGNAH